MAKFILNGKSMTADVESDTPLLWVIRDELNMTGTKFGCGIGTCGACTVHVGGRATRSCITPVASVDAPLFRADTRARPVWLRGLSLPCLAQSAASPRRVVRLHARARLQRAPVTAGRVRPPALRARVRFGSARPRVV